MLLLRWVTDLSGPLQQMLQCTSEVEKTQPQFWPTLENRKMGGGMWAATNAVGLAGAEGSWAGGQQQQADSNHKPKPMKMDKHFPNLLDTIDIEVEEAANNNTTSSSSSPLSPAAANGASVKSTVGGKGQSATTLTPSTSKRLPKKKQQLLLFSTDMNFNRN